MNSFSISELQKFSGIKAHTIRIWEQRYNALKPSRSEGNTRYYDNSQLKRLLNISSLIDSEFKISELCKMSDKKLNELIQERINHSIDTEKNNEYFISQLLLAGMAYDEEYLEKILSNCVLRLGMKNCYLEIIYPMLTRIGLLWSIDKISPSQEHFISNIIKQKLFSVIDSLPPARAEKDAWLLFLPENEFHEMGLLFAQYILRSVGVKTIYLGCNVPADVVVDVAKKLSVKNILLFLVHNDSAVSTSELISLLSNKLPKSNIHFSGNKALLDGVLLTKKMCWIKSVADLESQLN